MGEIRQFNDACGYLLCRRCLPAAFGPFYDNGAKCIEIIQQLLVGHSFPVLHKNCFYMGQIYCFPAKTANSAFVFRGILFLFFADSRLRVLWTE